MALAKMMVCLALCVLAASHSTNALTDDPQGNAIPLAFGDIVEANPRQKVNTDEIEPVVPDLKVTLQGVLDETNDRYFVVIQVTDIPIYVPTAEPPAEGDIRIPTNDDVENIQVYFANEEGRILEIRFNRFEQYLARLWKRPYHVLRDDGIIEITSLAVGNKYSATIRVPAELLPAKTRQVHAVVVDPTQRGGDKYFSYYRLYNYPIGFDWSMLVYQMYQKVNLYTLVPKSINENYSTWWEGI